ncbi:MAG: ABC transporter permease [Candidatus Neomarinimicrobiota bacterium]|mgnify:FL=1|jgi:ABC-2 type transport system permease protein|nr:ABC transporter permease [Candidatus Neomarinimicrobiota bacterium]
MIINLLRNELTKALYKKRTYIGVLLILLLIPFIVIAINKGAYSLQSKIYGQLEDSFIFIGSIINGYLATYIVITILISNMPFLYTIIPSEIISGEYQKGTFRIYLTRPPSRSLVLTSKLMYVVFSTVIIHIFFFLYTISISLIILNSGDLAVYHKGLLFLGEDEVIYRFILSAIISLPVMVTVSILCLMFSVLSRNAVAPIILTMSIIFIGSAISVIPIDLFELINPYLFTGYINTFLVAFYDPIPYNKIIITYIVSMFWSLGFVGISYYIFNERDITE